MKNFRIEYTGRDGMGQTESVIDVEEVKAESLEDVIQGGFGEAFEILLYEARGYDEDYIKEGAEATGADEDVLISATVYDADEDCEDWTRPTPLYHEEKWASDIARGYLDRYGIKYGDAAED